MQQGRMSEKLEMAKSMLVKGFDEKVIEELTQLSGEVLVGLKKEIKH